MKTSDIARLRLAGQRISGTSFEKPGEVVAWLGAVQAQDYLGALWAVSLRTRAAVEAEVERAVSEREIIRTWPMRRTLHFVAAADVRWMLRLLTPRVVAGMAGRLSRHFELDEAAFARSRKALARALEGGRQLTRNSMYEVLERARIPTGGGRGLHILSRLAQDGLICFGAREGRQQTFALLDEWSPPVGKILDRDESLAALASRYFTSHGPATLQDFAWWSGLTAADARAGVEMVKSQFIQESIDGQTCWLPSSAPTVKETRPGVHLLPAYDEYTVAYKDRSAVLDPAHAEEASQGILSPVIVAGGRVVGTWKRTLKRDAVVITTSLFRKFTAAETRAFDRAASRYRKFQGLS
ncbi:MAG TPA: winged helix DNA-binding domain-containing protein [Pyrinomonadaceae bacterium]|nr:winged helix DNA-binding domain-containing protein [Pyrinomonadaceae bacterium]